MTIAAGINPSGTELAEICRRYQIKELSLFGSAVRGEMRPDSDIDLLVEFMPDANVSLFGHFDAEEELSRLVGKKVDLVSKTALRGRAHDVGELDLPRGRADEHGGLHVLREIA